MNTIQKILIGVASVAILGVSAYFLLDKFGSLQPNNLLDTPKEIVSDYEDLLTEAEQVKTANADCRDKKGLEKQIKSLEDKLADLADRKQDWLDNVPKLPDVEPEVVTSKGRPGSEVPTLDSDMPPLPEIDVVDSNEPIIKMAELEQKIKNLLQELKALCPEEENRKVISDKCSDACKRHKDCAAYTEDVTAADLADAYNTCMEECPTWPKEMIKCINAIDIKTPNDCVNFVQCQLPQLYEERYLE